MLDSVWRRHSKTPSRYYGANGGKVKKSEGIFSRRNLLKKNKSFILLFIGLWGFCFAFGALYIGAAVAEESQGYKVNAVIQCVNNTFQSDVLFVTDVDHPLKFRLEANVTPPAPQGYLPAPTEYRWTATSGTVDPRESLAEWNEPSPGLQEIRVSGKFKYLAPQPTSFFSSKKPDIEIPFEASMKCLVPLKVDSVKDGKVNGFVVGAYPDPTDPEDLKNSSNPAMVKAHADVYQEPSLFYPITPETYRLKIFKDYTLGDFDLDPRFKSLTYPRYLVIDPRILRKIDLLETLVRNSGVKLSKFKIFYGYRSPDYNLGSREDDGGKTLKSGFSTHMYGLAVDILIDENDDLVLDDLDGDGKTTYKDAKVLLGYVNQLDQMLLENGSDLVGGAGWYPHHDFWERGEYVQSPYVHFDARGYAHGKNLVRWVGKDTISILKKKDPYGLKRRFLRSPGERTVDSCGPLPILHVVKIGFGFYLGRPTTYRLCNYRLGGSLTLPQKNLFC